MSIRHPKQKQIRLPFDVPKPGLSTAQKRICGVCRRRDSQYTCPRCNIPYCSLDCFKDESHAQCSEPFYRNTVLDSIAADPMADFEEKKKMIDMLRRFEQAQAEGQDLTDALEEEDSEDEDELERMLAGVDLDEVDSNKLFHLLPQKHRDAFIKALQDPESAEARDLLEEAVNGGEGEKQLLDLPSVLPWWEGDALDDTQELETAPEPEIVSSEVVSSINPPAGVGAKLAYNAIAICITYLHVLLSFRVPSLSEEYVESRHVPRDALKTEFNAIVPFLSDPKSTVRYISLREAWSSAWDAIGKTMDPPPPSESLIRLLSTLPALLHPPILTDATPRILLVLSDIYALFAVPKPGSAAPRKLAFYVAALNQLSRDDWLGLKSEAEREIDKLKNELESDASEDERPALKISPI